MKLRYLSNTYDPNQSDAPDKVVPFSLHETTVEAWHWHMFWLKDKIIGDPQPTEKYTVEELIATHMVGVYVEDGEA